MRLCLVEDIAASGLEPLTLTRPVHELLLGSHHTREQDCAGIRRRAGSSAAGMSDPHAPGGRASASRPAYDRQRSRLAGARIGRRGQQPMGSAGRLPVAR